jgi:hypothetical protein
VAGVEGEREREGEREKDKEREREGGGGRKRERTRARSIKATAQQSRTCLSTPEHMSHTLRVPSRLHDAS